jgi:hypothetical protein
MLLVDRDMHRQISFTGDDLLAMISSLCGLEWYFELLKWFIESVDPKDWCNARDKDGFTALHSVMYGHSSDEQSHFLLDTFIRMGVDPTVKSKYGTILRSCICRAFPEYLKFCVDLEIDINEASDSALNMGIDTLPSPSPAFTTMLENFAESKNQESIERCVKVARFLADNGYNFSAKDHLGNTCYDAIRHFGWSEMLENVLNLETSGLEHRNWREVKRSSEHRGWDSGFERESDARFRRPYVDEDDVLHALMVKIRAQRYDKDTMVVSTLKDSIRSVFSMLSNEYKASIHSTLHNCNSSMYGYLYLDDLRFCIDS